VIPTAQWNDGSTCKITGIIGSSGSDFTSLGGVNQTFSNFVIDCKSLLGKLLLTYNGGSFTVQRTFQVDATGSGIVQIARSSTQNTVNVGKYVQNGGIVYIIHAVSSTGTRALNVSGDFILDGNAIFGIINGRLSVAQAVTGVLAVGGAVEMRGSSRLVRDTARAHVIFNGTSKQRVALQNVSDSISIYVSNAQGVELTRNLSWTGTLVFTSGKLYLSKTMITLDSIIGASPTTYIQTDSIGVVRRFCKNSPVFYPVGSQTSYSPVTITNSGTPDWISVRASVDNSGSNNAADRVKLIWTIGEDTPGGTIATITLGWMSAAEGTNFALNRSTYSKIWNVTTRTEAGNGIYTLQTVTEPYSVTTYNVSTLSDFVVGKEWGSVSTSSGNPNLAVPHILTLSQNYPNPFNPVTIVEFTVPNISNVSLCVYDILGRMVMRVVEGVYNSGIVYRIPIDGSMLAAGTYFYRLEARPLHSNETAVLVRKLTLIK
ncbi:MAG: T9SS type A sorting domain-containing protein, partial [Bacteroidetes bacterium]|nr:T9SS type A sorting domain-containing protein [Bacteroidota bacterium]